MSHFRAAFTSLPILALVEFAQLVNMAVSKFITEPHTIELVPVATQDFTEAAEKAFKKHKGANGIS